VAWDGDRFVVAYQDQRNRTSELDTLDVRSDLFATRVDVDGTIVDAEGFAFAATAGGDIYPTLAAANGVTLIAGSVMRSEAPYVAYRVGYDLLGEGGNQWPVVAATALPGAGEAPLAVTFDATGSFDPDGAIIAYDWDFGDGAGSQEVVPVHTYEVPGFHVASLTVTDDQGAVSSTTLLIEATAPNLLPVAVASAEPLSGPAPLSVVFSASGSYDPDGGLGNIYWDFGDGWDYWGSPAYHTFTEPGTYPVVLTVWDADGATASDTVTIRVEGDDSVAPTVQILTPSSMAVIQDTLTVEVVAQDDVGIRGIIVLLDGRPVCASQTSPLTCIRSTSGKLPGLHRIGARSIDAAGNVGGDTVVVLFPTGGSG
jgi:PKD repeat protein